MKSEVDIANLEIRLKHFQININSVKSELADDQLRLKHISDLITAYESIVEWNYIDNLVRARRKRDRIFDNANVIK